MALNCFILCCHYFFTMREMKFLIVRTVYFFLFFELEKISFNFQMTRSNTSEINPLDNGTASHLSPTIDYLTHLDVQEASVFPTTVSTSPTTSFSSAVEVQDEVNEANSLVNAISSHFSVRPTKYGGRGCFANSDLTQGTIVYESPPPLSSTIARPFKKEVCGSCFAFEHGRTLKFKLASSKNQQHSSTSASSVALYFCSQACMNKFIALDVDSLYLESLLHVESLFIKGLTQHQNDLKRIQEEEEAETESILQLENDLKKVKDIELFISQKWQEAEIDCQLALSKVNPKQKKNCNSLYNLIPKMNEYEYLEIKYIIGILFHMYKHDNCQNNNLSSSSSSLELQILPNLQSNDVAKICKYPYLLRSYIRIYKFLRISTFDQLQPYITSSGIRSIISKELTNAFGIWSRDEPYDNREFYGYSLHPSASFFNHSCRPNLSKIITGETITFKLLKNVQKDDELLISYIPFITHDLEIRQKELQEWFFDCLCERCVEEKNFKNATKLAENEQKTSYNGEPTSSISFSS